MTGALIAIVTLVLLYLGFLTTVLFLILGSGDDSCDCEDDDDYYQP